MFAFFKRVSACPAVFLLLILVGDSFECAYAAESKKGSASGTALEKCWVFSQVTDQFGDVEVILGQTGLKVDCMRGTCRMISRKPTWDVQIYNLQDKRALTISNDRWTQKGVELVGGITKYFAGKSCVQERKVFQKLGATKYTVATGHFRKGSGAQEMFQSKMSVGRDSLILGVAYTASDKIACASEGHRFLQSLYKTPRLGFVPIEVLYIHPNDVGARLLRTRSWKTISLPASTFDYLKGAALAPSVESALFGRQMENIMEEMVK